MGFAEIACCNKCEIAVETIDENGMRHLCKRCQEIKILDDLVFLDVQTAILNARILDEIDRSIQLVDHTLDLLNDIKKAMKNNDTND
jgi:hypothetical protein